MQMYKYIVSHIQSDIYVWQLKYVVKNNITDYSFCILITLNFIKPYENIIHLYVISFLNKVNVIEPFPVFILKDLLSCDSLV